MAPHAHHPATAVRAVLALMTVSDSRDEKSDRSGARARELIEAAGHAVLAYAVVPDEPTAIRRQVEGWLALDGCDGVIVSGGTGIAARDRTVEALSDLFERRLDGFGELFRWLSYGEIGSAAMLSRAVGGVAGGRLLFLLPGSTPAVTLGLERLILPELGHLLTELRK